jgi:hypothetical protein
MNAREMVWHLPVLLEILNGTPYNWLSVNIVNWLLNVKDSAGHNGVTEDHFVPALELSLVVMQGALWESQGST